MTNKEIRESFTGGETGLKKNVEILTINEVEKIQIETRRSERERVIGEIEKWADGELNMPSRYYSELIKLLNKLK